MKIGFIGAGKVGVSLGKYFSDNTINVTGYYSLHPESCAEAADITNTHPFDSIESLVQENDIIFITVPDGIIHEIYETLTKTAIYGKCLVHCSGALSSEIFSDIENYGATGCSAHPICAVSSKLTGHKDLSSAYFTLEGNGAGIVADLLKICGNKYEIISANNKIKYHASAVFASNLVVGIYDTATSLLRECGLSEEFSENALKSLFLGNASNIADKGCVRALTGPVERADSQTVSKHLNSLNDTEREVYRLLSNKLVLVAQQKNPDRNYQDLIDILSDKTFLY